MRTDAYGYTAAFLTVIMLGYSGRESFSIILKQVHVSH
jgi:hypothetical protein